MRVDGKRYRIDGLECYIFSEHVGLTTGDMENRAKRILRENDLSDSYIASNEDRAVACIGPPGLTTAVAVIPRW